MVETKLVYIFALNIKTIKTMSENTTKYQKFNSQVVNKLEQKFRLTGYYIRQCLKNERNSITADTIKKEYKRLVKQVEAALNN